MRWVVVETEPKGKVPDDKIRAQAEASGASRYVLHKGQPGEATTLGLYADPMDPSKGGKLYSLSSLFLAGILGEAKVERSLINVVLIMEPPGAPNMRVLVQIEAGQVTRDAVLERSRAIDSLEEHVLQLQNTTVFSQHAELKCRQTSITWNDLAVLVNPNAAPSLLIPIPKSPAILLTVLGLAFALAGWFAYDQLVAQPEKKRRMAAELAKRDQTPAYLEAVGHELKTTGWDRSDLRAFIDSLRGRQALLAGWALDQITCDVQQCTTQWGRRGGLVKDLTAALPQETLVAGDAASGASSLEKAITRAPHEAKMTNLEVVDLPTASVSTTTLLSVAQKLTNAGLPVTLRELTSWDATPLTEVKPQAVLLKGAIEIPVMPHLANDAIGLLPPNILIQSMNLKVADGNMTLTIKGSSYAQQNTP